MNETQTHIYEFGNFRLDAAKRLLTKDVDEIVPLMPKAFDTLLYLVEHSGKVIEKDELMREIWADSIVEENNLTQNISILRKIFGEKPGEHRFIVTVPGHGYKFVSEVRRIEEEEKRRRGEEEIKFGFWFLVFGLWLFQIPDSGFQIYLSPLLQLLYPLW